MIFVGYFGGTRHQPRILGSAAVAVGIGTLVMCVAHFASPSYKPVDDGFSLMCVLGNGKHLALEKFPDAATTYSAPKKI